MRKETADSEFIRSYYGDKRAFRAAVRDDYCKVQLSWTCYIDNLCRAGLITPRQFATWSFPGGRKPRRYPKPALI